MNEELNDAYNAGYADGRGWARAIFLPEPSEVWDDWYSQGYEDGCTDRALENEEIERQRKLVQENAKKAQIKHQQMAEKLKVDKAITIQKNAITKMTTIVTDTAEHHLSQKDLMKMHGNMADYIDAMIAAEKDLFE